jgi:signal transduction histidine kinase
MTTVIFSDNGLGIPKEFQEKIFEMFFRVETDITGSGLGLYLVKMSVAKLGGKIKVDGGKGLGTTFTIQFDHK